MELKEFSQKVNEMFDDYVKIMYYKSSVGDFLPDSVRLNDKRIIFFWGNLFGIYCGDDFGNYDYLSELYDNLELYYDGICLFKELILPKYL